MLPPVNQQQVHYCERLSIMVHVIFAELLGLDHVLQCIKLDSDCESVWIDCEYGDPGESQWANTDDVGRVFDALKTKKYNGISSLDLSYDSDDTAFCQVLTGQFMRYIREHLVPTQKVRPTLKSVSLSGLIGGNGILDALASIEGLEHVKCVYMRNVPFNYYRPLLQFESLQTLELDTYEDHFDAARWLINAYQTRDNNRLASVPSIRNITIKMGDNDEFMRYVALLLSAVKMIGSNRALEHLTIDADDLLVGCCDDLWKVLGDSVNQNPSLISLALPIDPIVSRPHGEEARLALLNGLRNNYTLTDANVSNWVDYGQRATSSLFVHDDSRPFECYLDMNRRGRKAFAYNVDDAVHTNIENVGEESSIGWIKALKKKGDKNFDLDWICHVSKSNPLSLVWLRDSMIKKRRGNNVPKRKRGSGKKDATAPKKPSARSKRKRGSGGK